MFFWCGSLSDQKLRYATTFASSSPVEVWVCLGSPVARQLLAICSLSDQLLATCSRSDHARQLLAKWNLARVLFASCSLSEQLCDRIILLMFC
ncbi:hypothetical protein L195_g056357 [Trifolium pratense]|uniref:Uncharacterized protein n=1 Tax=Trifolium pratense TaxID=57577 RepID=A0A2K3KR94_TRIPR|nr:hypothetical protein L195_g056357 [Trifolium pratense]